MKRYWFILSSLVDCSEILFRKNLIKVEKVSDCLYYLTREDGFFEKISFDPQWEGAGFGKYNPGPYPDIDNVCKNCSKLFKDGKFCVKHPFLGERYNPIVRCKDFYPKDEYFKRRTEK